MFPSHGYDYVQWRPGTRKLFESNYLKANSPDGRRGFWIKHNILAPADPHRPAMLELSCVVFDQDGGEPRAVKQSVPMDRILVAKTGLRIEGEGVLLTDHETRTTIRQDDGTRASWDLTYESKAERLFLYPKAAYYTAPLPKKKTLLPAPRLIFNGSIDFDGETIDVVDWVGLRGHNWGSEHAHALAYGNCNLFVEDESAVIDMATVKFKFGPIVTPWLSVAVLRRGDRQYNFNSPLHFVTRKAVVDFPRWEVQLRSPHGQLRTKWSLDPKQCVGLRYLHPGGAVSYCYNTKFAHLEVLCGEHRLTSDQAELEFMFHKPVEGITLHGPSELPK